MMRFASLVIVLAVLVPLQAADPTTAIQVEAGRCMVYTVVKVTPVE